MRRLVHAWAKKSFVTGALRYPLSPVVVQSPRCIECAVAHLRVAIALPQVIVLSSNPSSRFQVPLQVSLVVGAFAFRITFSVLVQRSRCIAPVVADLLSRSRFRRSS